MFEQNEIRYYALSGVGFRTEKPQNEYIELYPINI